MGFPPTLKDWRKDISVKIHDSADLIPDENLRQTVLNEGGTVEDSITPQSLDPHPGGPHEQRGRCAARPSS